MKKRKDSAPEGKREAQGNGAASWGCPQEAGGICQRLRRQCEPGRRGCILYGQLTSLVDGEPSVSRQQEGV